MQILHNWKTTGHTEKSRRKPGRMAERSKAPDSRNSSVENSGSRKCPWVRIPILSWTRWGRAFSRQILSHWNVNWRWQSKAKKNQQIATSSVVERKRFQSAEKRRLPAETCETRKYAWVWTQIFSNGRHKPFSRLYLLIEKNTQWKGHKSKEKNVSTETRQNSRAV